MNRARPISACLPTGPPIDAGQRRADDVGPAGQVAVVVAAQVVGQRLRGHRRPSLGVRASASRVGQAAARVIVGPAGTPAVDRWPGDGGGGTAAAAWIVVGGPNGIVMPGAISMRRLDHRLRRRRRWRRRWRRRGRRTRVAADLRRLRERLVVGALQRAVHRGLPDVGRQARPVHRSARLVLQRLGALGGADPHRRRQRRRVADHPGVAVGVGVTELVGAGLGRRRPAARQVVTRWSSRRSAASRRSRCRRRPCRSAARRSCPARPRRTTPDRRR